MTDIYDAIFRRPAREQPPARRRQPRADEDFPMGPTGAGYGPRMGSQPMGVTGFLGRAPQPTDAVTDADRATARQRGQDAGDLALRHQRAPVLHREASAQPMGPTGVIAGGADPAEEAAAVTGAPAPYIRALVRHESGGDPRAKASTSSATGHAQFIDGTWLRMMRKYGPRYGMGEGALADLDNDAILDMRNDPRWSALMAAHYAQENAADLGARLNRRVREGEVYLAHFLGPRDAANLIRAAESESARAPVPAHRVVSAAAAEANRNVFYEGRRPRTAREVIARQTRAFRRDVFHGGK